MMFTVSWMWAGAVTVLWVLEFTVKPAAATVPKVTAVAPVNPLQVTTMPCHAPQAQRRAAHQQRYRDDVAESHVPPRDDSRTPPPLDERAPECPSDTMPVTGNWQ